MKILIAILLFTASIEAQSIALCKEQALSSQYMKAIQTCAAVIRPRPRNKKEVKDNADAKDLIRWVARHVEILYFWEGK